MNSILKISTTKGEVFYTQVPNAIEKSRNLGDNAVAWAKEVFRDVNLVQFSKTRPDNLMCLIDIDHLATPFWEFIVYAPGIPMDINLQEDENIEKVERWLDSHIYNMLTWAERT